MAERGVIFKDDFVSVPSKSWFDMSYDNLLSMNFGELVPTTCMECMAEDVIHAKSGSFTRLAPLVAPAFGKVNQFSYHFYVRNRDIWTHWDSFLTNADQKKSWQSSIGSTFTPPVMPYFDVRNLLFGQNSLFQSLNGNQSDLILFNDTTIATNKHRLSFLAFPRDVHYLVLWSDGSSQYSFVINAAELANQEFDTTSNKHYIVIPFIPNKNEIREEYFSGRYFYYNPFSNGSLFDYLGVDLSGLYSLNRTWVDSARTWCNNNMLGSGENYNINFSSPFTPSVEPSLESHFTSPVSIDFYDWLSKHAVLGFIAIYNGGNVATISSYGRYFKKLSGTDSYGDAIDPLYFNDESAKISSLPVRAYYFVYSEYFRDENYVDVNSLIDFTRDGDEFYSTNIYSTRDKIFDLLYLKIKSWEHDPYTTALPGAQRGSAVHFLPIDSNVKYVNSGSTTTGNYYPLGADANRNIANGTTPIAGTLYSGELRADLSAATIENFRFANATQRYLEKVARSGNRYYEYMKSIFGADIEDAKLNRPIYLGGDKTPVQVSEVLQTSATQISDSQPLGQMAGRAVAVGSDEYLEYVTPDNGFFVEIACVIPRVSYQQGLAPKFTRKVYLDYPLPDFAQLGEEAVKVGELFYSAKESDDDASFGYQSRYYQWKYNRDECHGEFKESLDHWTWTRKFDSKPVAGKNFLEVNPDYRQFAVTSRNQEHVYTHMYHDIQVQRALPVFGVPSL